MSTRNVQTVRALHAAFNRRDEPAILSLLAPRFAFTDEAEGVVLYAPDEYAAYLTAGWLGGISDAQVTDVHYVDGGDTVVAMYVVTGTNDGSIGPESSGGRRVSLPICEAFHFDQQGRIVRGESYYDRDSLRHQLESPRRGWRAGTLKSTRKAKIELWSK